MSIKLMAWAFHDSPSELSPAQVLLLLALCDGADDQGRVRFMSDTSQEALAKKTRMSRRSVQRALDVLVDMGLVGRAQGSVLDPYEYVILSGQIDASSMRHPDAYDASPRRIAPYIDGNDGSARKRRTKKKIGPLPEDWSPNQAHRDLARTRNVDVEYEAQTFRAHAEANAREQADWDAAFRVWILKARPSLAPAGGFEW